MQQKKDIRDLIMEKRVASGKSINQFAIETGIEPATLSKLERKEQGMNYRTLVNIALGFEDKVSKLFKELEDRHYNY